MGRKLEVLGLAETADRLGIHKVSVARMVREGRLRPDAVLVCGPVFRRSTVEKEYERRNE